MLAKHLLLTRRATSLARAMKTSWKHHHGVCETRPSTMRLDDDELQLLNPNNTVKKGSLMLLLTAQNIERVSTSLNPMWSHHL